MCIKFNKRGKKVETLLSMLTLTLLQIHISIIQPLDTSEKQFLTLTINSVHIVAGKIKGSCENNEYMKYIFPSKFQLAF